LLENFHAFSFKLAFPFRLEGVVWNKKANTENCFLLWEGGA